MLLADFIRQATRTLEDIYPSPEARGMVLMLCEDRLGVKNYTHIVQPDYAIAEDRLEELSADLERLRRSEPLQYVLGHTEFCGREFTVASGVLIPRPETELLVMEVVRHALDLRRPARVLDLCTGSGCIAWTAALDVPDSDVVAVDISEDALRIARSQFGQDGPCFVKADVLDLNQSFCEGSFDIIVSNPPYIKESEKAAMRSNVLDYEPELALFVPDDDALVFYRAVAAWALRLLRPGGYGIVEINETLGAETEALFRSSGLVNTRQIPDLSGKIRFVEFEKAAL